jgi:hypothetical protein
MMVLLRDVRNGILYYLAALQFQIPLFDALMRRLLETMRKSYPQ